MRSVVIYLSIPILLGLIYWFISYDHGFEKPQASFKQSQANDQIELLPGIERSSFEPIYLESTNMVVIPIVAIYEVSPNGMTFSPMPNKPIIGSNKLEIIKTSWANINVKSLSAYRDLWSAYNTTKSGRTVKLQMGPHFHTLKDTLEKIVYNIPLATFRNTNGYKYTVSMADMKSGTYRSKIGNANKWYVEVNGKRGIIELLEQVTDELSNIIYRRDTILLQNRIDTAYRLVRNIPTSYNTINMSMVLAFSDIIEFYNNLDDYTL